MKQLYFELTENCSSETSYFCSYLPTIYGEANPPKVSLLTENYFGHSVELDDEYFLRLLGRMKYSTTVGTMFQQDRLHNKQPRKSLNLIMNYV